MHRPFKRSNFRSNYQLLNRDLLKIVSMGNVFFMLLALGVGAQHWSYGWHPGKKIISGDLNGPKVNFRVFVRLRSTNQRFTKI